VTAEYRVRYKRSAWQPGSDRVRKFRTHQAAAAFVAKLHAGGRPDLSPLEFVHVERRRVSRWRKER
jgi:hypothetical protein